MSLAALEASPSINSPEIHSARPTWKVDLAITIPLTLIALAIRLPNCQLIPVFTDETEEIYRALLAARGQLIPLTNVDAYIGSLWTWLLALALRLSHYSLYAPRTVVLAFGVLTVTASYALGRAWAGRLGGLVASALMATAAVHVVVNSHVAYSNCITPLF